MASYLNFQQLLHNVQVYRREKVNLSQVDQQIGTAAPGNCGKRYTDRTILSPRSYFENEIYSWRLVTKGLKL